MSNKLDIIFDFLTKDTAKDVESANEFLEAQGDDFEILYESHMGDLLNSVAQYKLKKGSDNQKSLQAKFKDFVKEIQGKTIEQVFAKYPSLPQTAYSKLEMKDLSTDEIENIMKDGSFLKFIESQEGSNE